MSDDPTYGLVPDSFVDALSSSRSNDQIFDLGSAAVDDDAFYDFVVYQTFFDAHGLIKTFDVDEDERSAAFVATIMDSLCDDPEMGFPSSSDPDVIERRAKIQPWGVRVVNYALQIGREYLWRGDWSSDEEFASYIAGGFVDLLFTRWELFEHLFWYQMDAVVNTVLQRIELAGFHSWSNPPIAGVDGITFLPQWGCACLDLGDIIQQAERIVEARTEPLSVHGTRPLSLGHPVVNFGLRIVYRQQWRSVGNQHGDIIRTVPLGPKQTERVSIRQLKRNRVTRDMESSISQEGVAESVTTVKDSAEIVEEASKTLNLYVDQDTRGGFNCGLWNIGGTTKFGASEQSNNLSRETKSRISDAMQRTSSRVTKDMKVAVSTEFEAEFEAERSSELANPNDEIAITYVYQKLLKQYAVSTYLAEVEPVVFVTEDVPSDRNITDEWIRMNSAAIRAVLLDASLADALDLVVNSDDADGDTDYATALSDALKAAATAIGPSTDGQRSLQFGNAVETYRQVMNDARAYRERDTSSRLKRARLREHVCENVLHYMRSVWSREAVDSRMRRFRGILSPTEFDLVVDDQIDPLAADAGVQIEGHWRFNPSLSTWSSVADLIDPVGPVGFNENSAVYRLGAGASAHRLDELFQFHKLAYSTSARFLVNRVSGVPFINIDAESFYPHRVRPGTYFVSITKEFSFHNRGAPASLEARRAVSPCESESVPVTSLGSPYGEAAEGFLVDSSLLLTVGYEIGADIAGEPPHAAEATFRLDVLPPEIRDPELDEIELRNPLISGPGSSEALSARFTDEVVNEMFKLLPGLRHLWLERSGAHDADDEAVHVDDAEDVAESLWESSTPAAQHLLIRYYHEYLLRKRHVRFVVVDTNNVVLNIHAGTGSALEPFKRAHRVLDVKSAALDLIRRDKMLKHDDTTDPDIDRMVIVRRERE